MGAWCHFFWNRKITFDSLIYICLHSSSDLSTLFYTCLRALLHSSGDLSTLVYMRLWLVYICLHSSRFVWWLVCVFRIYPCKPLAFISYKAILQNKKRSRTSLPASFSASFLKKNISLVIFYCLTRLHCLVAFSSWDIKQFVYCNCFSTRLGCYTFWN